MNNEIDLDGLLGPPSGEELDPNLDLENDIPFSLDDLDRETPLEDEEPPKKDSTSDELAEVRRQLNELQSKMLLAPAPAAAPAPTQPQPQPQPQSQPNSFNWEQPEQYVNNQIQAAIARHLGPIASSTAAQHVQNFIARSRQEDPDWQNTEAEFQEIINEPATRQSLANMTDETREKTLKLAKYVAFGQARDKAREQNIKAGKAEIRTAAPKYGASYAAVKAATNPVQGWSQEAQQIYKDIKRDHPDASRQDILDFFKENKIK